MFSFLSFRSAGLRFAGSYVVLASIALVWVAHYSDEKGGFIARALIYLPGIIIFSVTKMDQMMNRLPPAAIGPLTEPILVLLSAVVYYFLGALIGRLYPIKPFCPHAVRLRGRMVITTACRGLHPAAPHPALSSPAAPAGQGSQSEHKQTAGVFARPFAFSVTWH